MRIKLLVGLCVTIFLVSSGCGPSQPAISPSGGNDAKTALKTIRIGSFSTAIDYSPYLIARSKKWFEEGFNKIGVNVAYTTFESLPAINESFAANRVDAVFEAEPPAIIGKAAGIDLRIIGISASLVQEIVVPVKSRIKTIKDLKGKKIGVLAGTSSHYGLLKLIRQAGLADDSIQIIDLKPPDAKGAFESGTIDAWAVWPPWEEQEIVDGKGRVLTGGDAQIQSILAIRGKLATDSPQATCILSNTLERAKTWIRTNPAEAEQIVAKELNIPINVVELAWPQHNWGAELSDSVKKDIQEKANFLKSKELISSPVTVADGFVETPTCPVN